MKIASIVLKGMPLGGGIEKYTEALGLGLAAEGHYERLMAIYEEASR